MIMQERCEHAGENVVINHVAESRRAHPPRWRMWRRAQILAAGARLRPQDTAFAASVGLATLPVLRRVRVAVFFTGDELRMPGELPRCRRAINSTASRWWRCSNASAARCATLKLVPDQLELTRAALRAAAADNDLIITSGGVSVGGKTISSRRWKPRAGSTCGRSASPGKPLAFGSVTTGDKECAFIGPPGNPVSAFVTFLTLVRPFVLRLGASTRCGRNPTCCTPTTTGRGRMQAASSCAR